MIPPRKNKSGPPARKPVQQSWQAEWAGMPEFSMEEKTPVSIRIYFGSAEDIASFAQLIGLEISDGAKYIWFPKIKKVIRKHLRYQGKK